MRRVPRYTRVGLVLSLGWLVALIPFLGGYGVADVVVFLMLVLLTRLEYRRDEAVSAT